MLYKGLSSFIVVIVCLVGFLQSVGVNWQHMNLSILFQLSLSINTGSVKVYTYVQTFAVNKKKDWFVLPQGHFDGTHSCEDHSWALNSTLCQNTLNHTGNHSSTPILFLPLAESKTLFHRLNRAQESLFSSHLSCMFPFLKWWFATIAETMITAHLMDMVALVVKATSSSLPLPF